VTLSFCPRRQHPTSEVLQEWLAKATVPYSVDQISTKLQTLYDEWANKLPAERFPGSVGRHCPDPGRPKSNQCRFVFAAICTPSPDRPLRRLAALAALPHTIADDAPQQPVAASDTPVECNSPRFDFGNLQWPLKPELLSKFLHSDGLQVGSGVSGVAAKAHRIRERNASALMVRDDGAVPAETCFQFHSCCHDAHYGLCVTRDSAIYSDAIKLENSLAACCDKALLFMYLQLKVGGLLGTRPFWFVRFSWCHSDDGTVDRHTCPRSGGFRECPSAG
jgi:hypothetical protein